MITTKLGVATAIALALSAPAFAQTACEGLKSLKLPDVKITSATASTGAAPAAEDGEPAAPRARAPTVPNCTVDGVIGREIKFRLQMPTTWNGKFAMGGQGNIAGSVSNMAASQFQALQLGYATAGTDTGHVAGGRGEPPTWAMDPFLGPERQVNFSHLAIHRVTEVSKAIVAAHYGKAPEKSYFAGCSNGGRQGLLEAQRYPDDFDAVLVSAPAFSLEQLLLPRVITGRAIFPNAKDWNVRNLDNADRMLLSKAVLEKCDGPDGLKDGILSDPASCKFDPAVLQCKGKKNATCLSKAGVTAVQGWWAGVKDAKGKPVTTGFPRGGEGDALWQQNLTGADKDPGKGSYAPNSGILRAIDYLAYFLGNPKWDYTKPTVAQLQADIKKLEANDATSPDLSEFRRHGGKLLINHGWTDTTISAFGTIKYFDSVLAHDATAANDVRLFLVPGMGHCGGGPGPQRVDWLTTLDKWATGGPAPEQLETGFATGGGSRLLCAHPKKQVFKGTGDGRAASQFACE